ncbi:ABC transporter ATP-binding protein [Bifidobacterium avesanii]|uniref:ATP-binding cassette domain-containing protein n=1 Tax=Bifidobacterium avesanii TaxID=1798157 RepID=A0A7K3TFE5_9BIFI|nr:ATP-binding cassette domain-containing protein [Bifidobacterium avesanii]KAB8294347.1 ABC transporter ATP-binding protein [Bifidobacterium avesanii]NEG77818.1 ATP-binding cassette domain-containing protein [Bifidobacterium avesanii]
MNTVTPIVLEAAHVTCTVPQPAHAAPAKSPRPRAVRPWRRGASGDARSESHAAPGKTVFRDLSFTVHGGDIVDLIGPSGSGKSTLLTTLALLNPHATATLTLDGTDSAAMTPERWRRLVAYLPQRPTLIGETVRDAITLPFTLKVHQRDDAGAAVREPVPDEGMIRRTLDRVGCDDIELERPPQDLSVGQQARVCMLRTLLTKPRVMLADEVDAGLDDENADRVADILAYAAHQGMAIIRVRHRPADGRATRTWRLADGTLTELAAHDAHSNEEVAR